MALGGVGGDSADLQSLVDSCERNNAQAAQREQEAKQAAAKAQAAQKSSQSGGQGGQPGSGGTDPSGGTPAKQPVDAQTQQASRQVAAGQETQAKQNCAQNGVCQQPSPTTPARGIDKPAQDKVGADQATEDAAKKTAADALKTGAATSEPQTVNTAAKSDAIPKSPNQRVAEAFQDVQSKPAVTDAAKPKPTAAEADAAKPKPTAEADAAKPKPSAAADARNLKRGDKGDDVKEMQRQLNASGTKPALVEDGKFGPKTQKAVNDFQRKQGMKPDGSVGARTREALKKTADAAKPDPSKPQPTKPDPTKPTDPASTDPASKPGDPANKSASFDKITGSGLSKMASGKITVNGHTYDFKSGGHGRGYLPKGDYDVSALQNTSQAGMVKDGVGFKANLSDKFDSRVGDKRTELRIHPDGGSAGTNGCIGIQGNAATLRQFKQDLAAEIARGGGHFTLHVG